ncbi:hypothetical protein B0H17DRAFT_1203177 [Mycena rosella]|uniref:Uncharacterized protein n=1 Tax=Mycena rosella TaxID=1033263 RepID=A0AAD7DCL5_MYCRO|nr:hypothetical protein B0H17DRAFT_1203177 [Mycena rosella]
MNLIPRLSNQAEFTFELSLVEGTNGFNGSLSLPSIISDISTLPIYVADGFSTSDIGQTITKVISGMTLPILEELKMESQEYPNLLLPWPRRQFLALSARSSFPTHLRALQLYHWVFMEAELLECLYSLPRLEGLAISDHQLTTDGGVNQLLLTDSLFSQLTAAPESPYPVPCLRFLGCFKLSLVQFDDQVYLDFLVSRLGPRHPVAVPFENRVYWLPEHHRELDPKVAARIEKLRGENAVVFSYAEAYAG